MLVVGALLGTPSSAAGDDAVPRLRVTRHRVPWPGLSRVVRVVHLSDLHVGRITPPALLARAVAAATQERPDLVALTGDFVNRDLRHTRELQQLVAKLPRPALAVLGNHDHWSGAVGVRAALRRGGVRVLTNESHELRGSGWALTVVGVDDGYTGHHAIRQALAHVADRRATLVLTHYPALAPHIAALGGRLILAGHTHGLQFSVPILTLAVARSVGLRYLAGFYEVGASTLYVNVGIGSARFRARVGERSQPELAVFELMPVGAAPAARPPSPPSPPSPAAR